MLQFVNICVYKLLRQVARRCSFVGDDFQKNLKNFASRRGDPGARIREPITHAGGGGGSGGSGGGGGGLNSGVLDARLRLSESSQLSLSLLL